MYMIRSHQSVERTHFETGTRGRVNTQVTLWDFGTVSANYLLISHAKTPRNQQQKQALRGGVSTAEALSVPGN